MFQLAAWCFDLDQQLFYRFNHSCRKYWLDTLMPWVTKLGGAVFTVVLNLILYQYGNMKLSTAAGAALLALTFSHLAVQICKRVFTRPRPYLVFPNAHIIQTPLEDPSFPSGHTTAAFSLAIVYALFFPAMAIPLCLLASAVGFSRIYLGLHFPSDVLMGALLGAITAISIFLF
ncbi:MAG TPA: phosphatase PAP2 family protein [Firmicutes bacterium]|nr:phosphatase PAP2 family protein [Bacillota bacterium]